MGNIKTSRCLGIAIGSLSLPAISGCSHVPSIEIFGAYFPDWMFCIVGGIVMATFLRTIMQKVLGFEDFCFGSLVLYLAQVSIFAVLGWLAFFGG